VPILKWSWVDPNRSPFNKLLTFYYITSARNTIKVIVIEANSMGVEGVGRVESNTQAAFY